MPKIDCEYFSKFCDEYDIEIFAHGYQGVPNQLYVEAMETHFVVPPFQGKPDLELLELKLERHKRGYTRGIRRVVFEEPSAWQRLILGVWRFLKYMSRKTKGK